MNKGLKPKIAVIGMGNLGCMITLGLLRMLPAGNIIFGWVDPATQDRLSKMFPDCKFAENNIDAILAADTIILTVKPGMFEEAISEDMLELVAGKLFISCMAGISFGRLEKRVGQNVIKCAPTIGANDGKSTTVWMSHPELNSKLLKTGRAIISWLGYSFEVTVEEDVDTAIITVGANFGIFAQHIQDYIEILSPQFKSLSPAVCRELIARTFETVGWYCANNPHIPIEEIIGRVATKGGVTEKMLKYLKDKKLSSILRRMVNIGLNAVAQIRNQSK